MVINDLALVLTGLGLAPAFPAMLHETPERFGREHSQTLIVYQMGFAYFGSTFLSPLIRVILQFTATGLLPALMLFLTISMLFCSERLIALTSNQNLTGDYHED